MYRYFIFIICGLIVLLLGVTMVSILQERAVRNPAFVTPTSELKTGPSGVAEANQAPTLSPPTPEPEPSPTVTITAPPPSARQASASGLTIYMPIIQNFITP